MSIDIADSCVHSSTEVEVISPSPLPLAKSSCVQNASIVTSRSLALNYAPCKKTRKCEDMDVMNDVEPDESLSSTSNELSEFERNSSPVTLLSDSDKCSQVIDDENQQSVLISLKRPHFPESRGIAATSRILSDDVNAPSSSIDDDCSSNICDLVTQSSTVNQSFHSCAAVDSQSSLVNARCLLYIISYDDAYVMF